MVEENFFNVGLSDHETIYALSSAKGKAGIAVFRVSGLYAFEALSILTKRTEIFSALPRLRWLYHPQTGQKIDQALILMFQAPASFTGENVVELHVHGGIAITSLINESLACIDELSHAQPGAFVQKAYANNKMSLVEVEGLSHAINAETIAQLRFSQKLVEGALLEKVKNWQKLYLKAIALVEATIDFADEEIPRHLSYDVMEIIHQLIREFEFERQRCQSFERIRNGVRIALIGPPNVGKSSLLNALVGEDRCIVSNIAGTTRDTIDIRVEWQGNLVILEDTAGIRKTNDKIENFGIERSKKSIQTSDICLFLKSPDTSLHDINNIHTSGKKIFVQTKSDQMKESNPQFDYMPVSIHNSNSIHLLRNKIIQVVEKLCDTEGAVIGHERHQQDIKNSLYELYRIIRVKNFQTFMSDQPEILVEILRSSLLHISNIISLPDTEDILGEIFSSFCIGK